jgi:hypothetical protein
VRDLVAKMQSALFESPEQKLVNRPRMSREIDQRIEVGMFDFEFDQVPFWRM